MKTRQKDAARERRLKIRVPITQAYKQALQKIQDEKKYENIAEVTEEYLSLKSEHFKIHPDSIQHYAEQCEADFNEKKNRTSSSPPNTPQHQPDPLEHPSPMDPALDVKGESEYYQGSLGSAGGHPDSPSPPNTPPHQPGPLEFSAPVAPMNHDSNVQMIPVPYVPVYQQEIPMSADGMSADDPRMPAQGNGEAGSSGNDTDAFYVFVNPDCYYEDYHVYDAPNAPMELLPPYQRRI